MAFTPSMISFSICSLGSRLVAGGHGHGAEGQLLGHSARTIAERSSGCAANRAGCVRMPSMYFSMLSGEFDGSPVSGRVDLVRLSPVPDEIGVEEDVGVEDLARRRIHAAGTDGKSGAGGDPAERVVVDVFGVPRGVVGLLPDFDGVDESGLLEGLVPFQDSRPDRGSILDTARSSRSRRRSASPAAKRRPTARPCAGPSG